MDGFPVDAGAACPPTICVIPPDTDANFTDFNKPDEELDDVHLHFPVNEADYDSEAQCIVDTFYAEDGPKSFYTHFSAKRTRRIKKKKRVPAAALRRRGNEHHWGARQWNGQESSTVPLPVGFSIDEVQDVAHRMMRTTTSVAAPSSRDKIFASIFSFLPDGGQAVICDVLWDDAERVGISRESGAAAGQTRVRADRRQVVIEFLARRFLRQLAAP